MRLRGCPSPCRRALPGLGNILARLTWAQSILETVKLPVTREATILR